MDVEYDFGQGEENQIVYVRPVKVADLPQDVRDQVGSRAETLYAVCSESGEQLALVGDRKLAFLLARQNDLAPVTVH